MKIHYFGHSAVAFEVGSHTVLVDPFLKDNPHYNKLPDHLKPSTIVVTHGHEDHVGDAVALSQQHQIPVMAVWELANHLGSLGAQAMPCGLGGRVNHDWGWSKMVPAFHSSSYGGQYMGQPAGVILNFGEHVVYHAGDTCLFSDMKLIAEMYQPTVALLPMGGHFTMDIYEAVKAVEFLRPEVVIPIHYGTFPPLSEDPQEFKRQVEAKNLARVQVVKPGEIFEVMPARR